MAHHPLLSDAGSPLGATSGGSTPSQGAPICPLELPRDCQTTVLFGGTFDPPHRWHMRGALAAARTQPAPCLVVIPAARNPLKSMGPVASDADRIAMVECACAEAAAEAPGVPTRVWADEIERTKWERAHTDASGPSYTIDTVRRLRQLVAQGVTLRLIIGVDQACAFHAWRDCSTLASVAEPLVMPRDGIATREEFEKAMRASGAWTKEALTRWGERFLEGLANVPIASTRVRETLKRGEETPDLDPSVRAYIDAHGLYR